MDLNLLSYTIASLGRSEGPESDHIITLQRHIVLKVENPKPSLSIRA